MLCRIKGWQNHWLWSCIVDIVDVSCTRDAVCPGVHPLSTPHELFRNCLWVLHVSFPSSLIHSSQRSAELITPPLADSLPDTVTPDDIDVEKDTVSPLFLSLYPAYLSFSLSLHNSSRSPYTASLCVYEILFIFTNTVYYSQGDWVYVNQVIGCIN